MSVGVTGTFGVTWAFGVIGAFGVTGALEKVRGMAGFFVRVGEA